MEERDEVIDAIDDSIVRRLVRIAVHVRGYAPYYAATVALLVVLTLMPRADEGANTADGAFAASQGGAAGAAGRARPGTTSVPPAAPGLSPAAADALVAGAAGFGAAAGAVDGMRSELALADVAGSASPLPTPPAAPAGSDVPAFDPGDVDYGDGLPDACAVKPPAPAPAVAPGREAENAQGTAEAATGAALPVKAAPYAEQVAGVTGCPDLATVIPLPALPGLPI